MKTPTYRKQKSKPHDRAFVELDGERHYLGHYGSPASKAEYHRVIAEWTANGGALPVPTNNLTIVELCERFDLYAEKHYGPCNELAHFRTVTAAMIRLYGRTPAAAFGPLAFKAVRQGLLSTRDQRGKAKPATTPADDATPKPREREARQRSRQYVNALAARIKRVFKWAVSEELVSPTTLTGLQAVAGLKRGRCEAPETELVMPVSDEVIDETVKHLTPTLVAMVRLQQCTGMRPGELCIMRTCDIDTSGKVWTYRPKHHKTEYRGRTRTVYLGPRAQAILLPHLRKELEAYIFSPAQSERERLEARHAARETPVGQGNEPGTNRQRNPKRTPGDRYTTGAYARAVTYACIAAFGDDKSSHWRPNRLRHSFATMVRREHGLEAAQVLLGHAAADVTQVYAERDTARAVQVAAKIG